MKPEAPGRVKLFSGILFSDDARLEMSFTEMENEFGPMDYQSPRFDFDISDYYVPEMGAPIFRMFVSFEKLISPDEIASIKIQSNEIENRLARQGHRRVNLDTGYMDYDKVVLASAKYNGQKIYLSNGIWADLTLHYEKGVYRAYPWSFPDFKSGLYNEVFLEIRQRFKKQRKQKA